MNKYKKYVDKVNKRTSGNNGVEIDETKLIGNPLYLMNVVNSLSKLIERKQVMDRYTNITTMLLNERSLDSYAKKENDVMVKRAVE